MREGNRQCACFEFIVVGDGPVRSLAHVEQARGSPYYDCDCHRCCDGKGGDNQACYWRDRGGKAVVVNDDERELKRWGGG